MKSAVRRLRREKKKTEKLRVAEEFTCISLAFENTG